MKEIYKDLILMDQLEKIKIMTGCDAEFNLDGKIEQIVRNHGVEDAREDR